MDILTGILLGAVQGVVEWLPVSSEAVLTIVLTRLGADPVAAVNAAVWMHTGTMLAALLYFRGRYRDILAVDLPDEPTDIAAFSTDQRLFAFLLLATVLTGIVGGTIYLLGIAAAASSPDLFAGLTAAALLLTGLLHHLGDGGERTLDTVDRTDTALSGVLQGLAILPGASRSGLTSFAFLHRDFSPRDAFELSFLMSVPAILAANIGLELLGGVTVSVPLVAATLTAFVVGYATIGTVLDLADHASIPAICVVLAILSVLPVVI